MTSGWPQDQRDLRWPAVDDDDTGPTARTRGRVATEAGPGSAKPSGGTEFGSSHPSGPLPVGPMPRSGRLGRGKFRDADPDDAAGDADYDWIRYLGEAGPAQNSAPRASAPTGAAAARPPGVRSTPPAARPPAVRSTPPATDSPAPPVRRPSTDAALSWPSADPALPRRAGGASGLQVGPGARPRPSKVSPGRTAGSPNAGGPIRASRQRPVHRAAGHRWTIRCRAPALCERDLSARPLPVSTGPPVLPAAGRVRPLGLMTIGPSS